MRVRVPVVAVLVVLAGCSGIFGGGGEQTATLTPAAVPTDQPTSAPIPRLAPGLTGRGIENANALVTAHESFLRNRSFTRSSNTTGLTPNGTVVRRSTERFRAGPPGAGIYTVTETNGSGGSPYTGAFVRTEIWAKGGQAFLNGTYEDGSRVYDHKRIGVRLGTTGDRLRSILEPFGVANTSVTKRTHDGTTRYLVRGTTRTDRQGPLRLRLVVDSRGVIHSYRTVQRASGVGIVARFVTHTRISGINATDAPERPSWVDMAMNRTTHLGGTTRNR